MGDMFAVAFQFHYGSIKGLDGCRYNGPVELFQFHYGSIKGSDLEDIVVKFISFQFHYGSIKGSRNRRGVAGIPDFNSTMVRLKGFDAV